MGTNQQAIEQVFRAKDETGPAAKSFQSHVERAAAAASSAMQRAGGLMASAMSRAWDIVKKAAQIGAATLAAGFALAMKGATEQQDADAKLAASLSYMGAAAEGATKRLQEHASALQRVSKFGDDAIEQASALIATLGRGSEGEIKRATAVTLDLATALKTDLQSAAILVGKAMAGETGTLSRYGIVLDQARVQTEGFAYVIGELETKFGGQAAAAAQTFAGRITQLKNAFGDMLEDAVMPVIKGLTDFFNTGDNMSRMLNGLQAGVSGLTKFIGDLFTFAGPAFNEFFSRLNFTPILSAFEKGKKLLMEWAASPALKSLMGMFGDLGSLIGTVADAVMTGLGNAFEVVGPIIDVAARAISAVIRVANDAVRVIKDLWEQATGLFTAAGQMIAGLDEQANRERVQAAVDKTLGNAEAYAAKGREVAAAFIGGLEGTVTARLRAVQREIAEQTALMAAAPNEKWVAFHREQISALQKSIPLIKAASAATANHGNATNSAANSTKKLTSVVEAHLQKQKEFSLQVNLDTLALTKSFGNQGQATEAVAKIHGKMAWDMLRQAQMLGQQYPPELVRIATAWLQLEHATVQADEALTDYIGQLPKLRNYVQEFTAKGWLPEPDQWIEQVPVVEIASAVGEAGRLAAAAFSESFLAAIENGQEIGRAIAIGIGSAFSSGMKTIMSAAAPKWVSDIFGPFVDVAGQFIGDWLSNVFGGPTNEELLKRAGASMGRAWRAAFTAEVEAALAKAASALPRAGSGKLDVTAAQFMPGVLSALLDAATSFGPEFQRRLAESVGHGVNYLMKLTGVSQAEAFRQMEPVLEQAVALALKYGQTLSPQLQGLIEQARNLGVEFGGLKGIISAAFQELVAKGDLGADAMYRLLDVAKQAGMEADDVFSALNDTLAAQEQAIIAAELQMEKYNRQIAAGAKGIFDLQKNLAALRVQIQEVVQGLRAAAESGDLTFSFTGQAGRERSVMGGEAWNQIQRAIREGQNKQGIVRWGKAQDIVKGTSPEHQQLVMQYIELVNQRTLMINSLKEAREANQYLLQSRNKLRDDLPKLRNAAEQTRDYLKDLRDYFLSGGSTNPGNGGGGGGTQPPDNNEPEKSSKLDVNLNHHVSVATELTNSDALSRNVARELTKKREYVAEITKAVNDYISSDPGVWTH